MSVELLSLSTAFFFGLSSVLASKGMANSNAVTGVFIASLVQVVFLTGLLLVSPPPGLVWMGIALFVASGILASALARLLNFISLKRLGVAVSTPLVGSSPLFSALFAALLIGEALTANVVAGTALVVAGIALIGGRKRGASRRIRGRELAIPILSASFYGASSVVRKLGLIALPEPTLGALVGAISSLAFYSAYFAVSPGAGFRLGEGSLAYLASAGVAFSLAWLGLFNALERGEVSVVSPLVGTNPLFSLLLGRYLLRSSEELSRGIVLGCLAIVAGAAIITVS